MLGDLNLSADAVSLPYVMIAEFYPAFSLLGIQVCICIVIQGVTNSQKWCTDFEISADFKRFRAWDFTSENVTVLEVLYINKLLILTDKDMKVILLMYINTYVYKRLYVLSIIMEVVYFIKSLND